MLPQEIVQFVTELYHNNNFMQYCGIRVVDIKCGEATVGLSVDSVNHTNLNGKLHGGVLMTLMDNATGVAAASIGKRAVTVSSTTDFIKGGRPGHFVTATAHVCSVDGNVLTLTIKAYDQESGELLGAGICSMMAIADFPGIPAKW